jgi:hypothetical protein
MFNYSALQLRINRIAVNIVCSIICLFLSFSLSLCLRPCLCLSVCLSVCLSLSYLTWLEAEDDLDLFEAGELDRERSEPDPLLAGDLSEPEID